ncbi:MAG: transcription antitermination protein NusB [Clostridiales bacterium]|jgi:N utilization substance protein B|nr:transcription antitermination protein NusB [Clostridiales bacterium]
MKRRTARENAFVAAFQESFQPGSMQEIIDTSRIENEQEIDAFGEKLLTGFVLHREAADKLIEPKLKNWKMNRIPRVCLVALELAVTEMFFGDEEDMDSVIINEAVELAKKFGGEEDYQFVNGVLGSIARERAGQMPEDALENAQQNTADESPADKPEIAPEDTPKNTPESDPTC